MVEVTNSKIKSFKSKPEAKWEWNDFRGFSLLFDNPGGSYKELEDDLLKKEVNLEKREGELYKILHNSLKKIDLKSLIHNYSFCPLPYQSYHVTVWDGLNDYNCKDIKKNYQSNLRNFLDKLPESLANDTTFTGEANKSLLTNRQWDIKFKIDEVVKWDNITIVTKLKPADPESKEKIQILKKQRIELYKTYGKKFNLGVKKRYQPHITLGYFSNKNLAEEITSQVKKLNKLIINKACDITIKYPGVSLYGFTDMATFYKLK